MCSPRGPPRTLTINIMSEGMVRYNKDMDNHKLEAVMVQGKKLKLINMKIDR